MLFGSNGNNNICLAGCQQSSLDQYLATGYNPAPLRNCSCWCNVCTTCANTCMLCYVVSGNSPRIYAGLQGGNNYSLAYIRNCDRIHGVNLTSESSTFGCVRFTHPLTTSYAVASYMYSNLPLSNTTPCVTIQAASNYGYFFSGWRANSLGGGLISSTATINILLLDIIQPH